MNDDRIIRRRKHFSNLLNKKMKIEQEIVRLLSGLEKLSSISAQTAILQEDLKVSTEEVNSKAEKAEAALKIVTAEADKVAKEKVR